MNCIIMQLMLIVCRDIIKVSKLLGEEHTQGPRRYSVVPQECLSVTTGWWWGGGVHGTSHSHPGFCVLGSVMAQHVRYNGHSDDGTCTKFSASSFHF